MQWSPHINMLLQRIVYPDSPSVPFEQYYSTAIVAGKRLGDPNFLTISAHNTQLVKLASHTSLCRSFYILYILIIGLLDSNDELTLPRIDCNCRSLRLLRIWSSSCKSVHNRSNISYTQVNTRNTWCTPPGTASHTTHYMHRNAQKPTGLRFSWDLMTPWHHASELPTFLQYTQQGYTAQLIQLLMDDLSANTHLQLHIQYHT